MGLEEVQMRNLDHRANRAGWLRAAVLGANDGLVSTSSLMIGIAAAWLVILGSACSTVLGHCSS
jgi:VIT1/CCC1 family predicted Fe2+/Mn2+ transporter